VQNACEAAEPSDNVVVFSASSAIQSAQVYEEQNHGYFTYFLLKKMQEKKDAVKYGELFKYISDEVEAKTTGKTATGISTQNPTVTSATNVKDTWKNWGLDDMKN
jgi:hypothetical protein